ncbi:MAG TPA: dTDP-4-dehydrorhamnose reductase [Puia sp.]|nr:dTDP-4-dehydrorhamnose reductase [Puia sp.]
MRDTKILRVAVTGSSGQLGNEFIRIAGNYTDYHFLFLTRENFPLDQKEKMTTWLKGNPVDIFIHCAAYTAVDKAESEKEKAFMLNGSAAGLIASVLSETATKLIYISTDYVFDGKSAIPLTEDAEPNPVNVYGASKLEGEKLALKNNPLTQVIRTSWVYSSHGNNFVKTMIRLMKERNSINVVNDQIGSPTYASDLAEAIMQMLKSNIFIPGIYHYSNEGETSWFAFAEEIRKQTGSSCEVLPIPSSGFPTPAKRPAYSLLDKTKIKKDYGLSIPAWRTSLAVCIDLLKKNVV